MPPGGNCTINVTFTPSTTGSRPATLEIFDSGGDSPQKVPLAGDGSYVSLSPSPVNFGNQPVGQQSSPIPVTLTNHNTGALTITSISITGADKSEFAQTNNCPSSVPSGGTCTINVTFTPAKTGARSATLTVDDSDAGNPDTDALLGTGT